MDTKINLWIKNHGNILFPKLIKYLRKDTFGVISFSSLGDLEKNIYDIEIHNYTRNDEDRLFTSISDTLEGIYEKGDIPFVINIRIDEGYYVTITSLQRT